MNVFIDAEFTTLNAPALLSIGLVADDGRECYVELAADWRHVNAFAPQGVVPPLGVMPVRAATRQELGRLVGEWQLALGQPAVDVVYDHAEESHEFRSEIVMSDLRLASVPRNATDTNMPPLPRELYSANHVFANKSETLIRAESRSTCGAPPRGTSGGESPEPLIEIKASHSRGRIMKSRLGSLASLNRNWLAL